MSLDHEHVPALFLLNRLVVVVEVHEAAPPRRDFEVGADSFVFDAAFAVVHGAPGGGDAAFGQALAVTPDVARLGFVDDCHVDARRLVWIALQHQR